MVYVYGHSFDGRMKGREGKGEMPENAGESKRASDTIPRNFGRRANTFVPTGEKGFGGCAS